MLRLTQKTTEIAVCRNTDSFSFNRRNRSWTDSCQVDWLSLRQIKDARQLNTSEIYYDNRTKQVHIIGCPSAKHSGYDLRIARTARALTEAKSHCSDFKLGSFQGSVLVQDNQVESKQIIATGMTLTYQEIAAIGQDLFRYIYPQYKTLPALFQKEMPRLFNLLSQTGKISLSGRPLNNQPHSPVLIDMEWIISEKNHIGFSGAFKLSNTAGENLLVASLLKNNTGYQARIRFVIDEQGGIIPFIENPNQEPSLPSAYQALYFKSTQELDFTALMTMQFLYSLNIKVDIKDMRIPVHFVSNNKKAAFSMSSFQINPQNMHLGPLFGMSTFAIPDGIRDYVIKTTGQILNTLKLQFAFDNPTLTDTGRASIGFSTQLSSGYASDIINQTVGAVLESKSVYFLS